MQTKTDSVEKLWELYSDQDFRGMLDYSEGSSEAAESKELEVLARLELGKPRSPLTEKGLFADLVAAMVQYHDRNYEKSAMELSRWLLNRGYHGDLILDRFYFSCSQSQRFDLLFTVCSKLLKGGHSHEAILGGYLLGAHETGKHEQVVKGYESFGQKIKKTYVLHRVALSYIQLRRNREAETMLMTLYRSISGKSYELDLEQYRKEYAQKLPALLKQEKQGELPQSQRMELGMAHLFSGQYSQAIQVFQSMVASLV
ncbi:MAG: hypothetical protein KDK25_02945 [Leptospiraceae bacterium]|nr:hypothetical protein [Leptospiraceae bacterium]